MSEFLMFRGIVDDDICFDEGVVPFLPDMEFNRDPITDHRALSDSLRNQVLKATEHGDAALALSGGIDSAILARFMPEGSTAYTFRCRVPGVDVTDETPIASKIAEKCHLVHKVVDITWEDVISSLPTLFSNKGAPVHSIEAQIYKAALQCKDDGFSKFIFGENADVIYGGLDGLISKDWLFGEYVDRYTHVMPYKVLNDYEMVLDPFWKHCKDGHVDSYFFMQDIYRRESLGSYLNACSSAGVELVAPFSRTKLDIPLDLQRVRGGDTKYLVRSVFSELYPGMDMPKKLPMPRPTEEWLKDWSGPKRDEFIPHSADGLSGDQRWLIFCLEQFLDYLDEVCI